MSLGIMIKGSEGIVLAADSRVTLFNPTPLQLPQNTPAGSPVPLILIPASFDNATKLLKVKGQQYVGAVTYGLGAFMTANGPRTMRSFIPEFERELEAAGNPRLSVRDFAEKLSYFFLARWNEHVSRPPNPGEEINFFVGGYDQNAPYGSGYAFVIPTSVTPAEQNAGPGQFGISWGGQNDFVNRLLFGFEMDLPEFIRTSLNLTPEQALGLKKQMDAKYAAGVPYQFLPLQDCVDLAVFLIQGSINFQKFRTTVIRAVGGPVEVATITREEFKFVSQKMISAAEGGRL